MFAVFDQYEITDPHKIAELKPVQGRVAIQAKYTPVDPRPALDDKNLDQIQKQEDEQSEEEKPPVYLGDLRIKIMETRMFEPQFRHKLRFYIEGQDESGTTSTQEETKTPKWPETFTFKVFQPKKGDDFPQLVIEDMDDKENDKILTSSKVEFGKLTEKTKGKLEKWCAFFNATKKQVKLSLFYKQADK